MLNATMFRRHLNRKEPFKFVVFQICLWDLATGEILLLVAFLVEDGLSRVFFLTSRLRKQLLVVGVSADEKEDTSINLVGLPICVVVIALELITIVQNMCRMC